MMTRRSFASNAANQRFPSNGTHLSLRAFVSALSSAGVGVGTFRTISKMLSCFFAALAGRRLKKNTRQRSPKGRFSGCAVPDRGTWHGPAAAAADMKAST